MEDLWKDIQLSSLHENPTTNSTTTIFQDFLSPRDEEDQTAASIGNARCFKASNSINSQLNPLAVASSASSFACSPNYVRLSCFSRKNKRVSEGDQHKNDDSGGDPRYKRMMKNRESAARSRARRQAYTTELEREVAQLVEENGKLKEQLQQKLLLSVPAEKEIPKKQTHTRSLTAPF
uniref:BZIP domain-containing protein n=1 Tax=Opuntia streptacantha TaxID=393608 RepID=A0A7C8Z7I3_OPUST